MQKVNILGVNLAKLSKLEVLKKIEFFLLSNKPHLIVTPNAEFILRAQHDEEFFHILNEADLAVLDGSGPQFASWATGSFVRRYPGADLVIDLLKIAHSKNVPTLILNWRDGLSSQEEITKSLATKFPGLNLKVINISRDGADLNLNDINIFQPKIIISTLGAPFQEKLLFHVKDSIPSLRVTIGVGGALDFLIGKVRRAPNIMRYLGIEWLWRLFQKPNQPGKAIFNRYKRIWNATFVFVYKFLRWQYILPFFYRTNVVCWLYKKVGNDYFVLMVERADQPGHWQIPQGGTDGENPATAGARELWEELGTTNFEMKKIFKNVWSYKFKKQPKSEIKKHSGYKGQRQSLAIAEYLGTDKDIKLSFWDHTAWQWVNTNNLLETAFESRRLGYQKFLNLFNQHLKDEV